MHSLMLLMSVVAVEALIFSKVVSHFLIFASSGHGAWLNRFIAGRLGILRWSLLCRRIYGDQYVIKCTDGSQLTIAVGFGDLYPTHVATKVLLFPFALVTVALLANQVRVASPDRVSKFTPRRSP